MEHKGLTIRGFQSSFLSLVSCVILNKALSTSCLSFLTYKIRELKVMTARVGAIYSKIMALLWCKPVVGVRKPKQSLSWPCHLLDPVVRTWHGPVLSLPPLCKGPAFLSAPAITVAPSPNTTSLSILLCLCIMFLFFYHFFLLLFTTFLIAFYLTVSYKILVM